MIPLEKKTRAPVPLLTSSLFFARALLIKSLPNHVFFLYLVVQKLENVATGAKSMPKLPCVRGFFAQEKDSLKIRTLCRAQRSFWVDHSFS